LARILGIQREINNTALLESRPQVSLINKEEETRIEELIAANSWPDGWDGQEVRGDELYEIVAGDGQRQPLLPYRWVNS
jgi:DNA sulfur modification protein DndC